MTAEHEHIWTDETCTIREVVERQLLPIMVRVTEGIYGETEAETFSQGDLLMIHKVLTLSKVVACFVDGDSSGFRNIIKEDNYGYLEKEEILIPLGYSGKLKIFCPDAGHTVYYSVQQLIKYLPRFVKVIEHIKTTDDKIIRRNEIIELDRHLPSQGLVCKWNGKMVCVSEDTKGQFLLMPDETEYTLKEVVNKFPFPQFVTFLDNEFPMLVTKNLQEAVENVTSFQGQALKIIDLKNQQTIIGHHKAASSVLYKTVSEEEEHCKRSVVLIPMDSEAANDIDVNIPAVDDDDNNYELMQTMNFSRTSLDDESFDGTLYLEFVKRPKVYMYEELPKDMQYKRRPPPPPSGRAQDKPPPPLPGRAHDKPPPLPGRAHDKPPPPLPGRAHDKPPPLPVRTKSTKTSPVTERTRTAKTTPIPGLDICTQDIEFDLTYQNEQSVMTSTDQNQETVITSTSTEKNPDNSNPQSRNHSSSSSDYDDPPLRSPGPRKPTAIIATSSPVEEDVYEICDKNRYVNMKSQQPAKSMPCNVTDDEKRGLASRDLYITKVPEIFRRKIKRVQSELVEYVKRKTYKRSKSSVSDSKEDFVLREHDHVYATPDEAEIDDVYDYPDLSKMKLETLKRRSAGCTQQRSDHQKQFESLTTTELTKLLIECRMENLGKICKKEGLNGSFFINISDSELLTIFSLDKIQLTKFKKIRDDGWKSST